MVENLERLPASIGHLLGIREGDSGDVYIGIHPHAPQELHKHDSHAIARQLSGPGKGAVVWQNAGLLSPNRRICVPLSGRDVVIGYAIKLCQINLEKTSQYGDDGGLGNRFVRRKGGFSHSDHNLVFLRPLYIIVEPVLLQHIGVKPLGHLGDRSRCLILFAVIC